MSAPGKKGKGGGGESRYQDLRGDFAELFWEHMAKLAGAKAVALMPADARQKFIDNVLSKFGGDRTGNLPPSVVAAAAAVPKLYFMNHISEEAGSAFVKSFLGAFSTFGMAPPSDKKERIEYMNKAFEDASQAARDAEARRLADMQVQSFTYFEILGHYTDPSDRMHLASIIGELEKDAKTKVQLTATKLSKNDLVMVLDYLRAGNIGTAVSWAKRVLDKPVPSKPEKGPVTKFFDDTKAGFAGVRDEANKVLGEMSRKPYEVTIAQHMTLQEFANQQGVNIPVAYLRVVNKLDHDHLVPGQVIKVVTEVPALFKKMAERMEGRR